MLTLTATLWYFGFKDWGILLGIISTLLAVYSTLSEKAARVSQIYQKRNEYEKIIDKIVSSSFAPLITLIPNIERQHITEWKEKLLCKAGKKFISNPSLEPKDFLKETLETWFQLVLPSDLTVDDAVLDFFVYSFTKENFPGEPLLNTIEKKYDDFDSTCSDDRKRPFLSLLHTFYIDRKKTLNELRSTHAVTNREKLKKAFYFLKGVLEQVQDFMKRFDETFKVKEKNIYLSKLFDELRLNFQSRGISIEKFGEAFLDKVQNAYIIFKAEAGRNDRIRKAIRASEIRKADLYFTGPHLFYPDSSINSAMKLREKIIPKLPRDYPHVLFIARILPSDVSINAGKLTPMLKRINKNLVSIGELSESVQNYLTLLDEFPIDFFEKLNVDFLILSLREDDKLILREKEDDIRKLARKDLGIQIEKLTDYSRIENTRKSRSKLSEILKNVGIRSPKIAEKYANEIINRSKNWRYTLYGSPTPKELLK